MKEERKKDPYHTIHSLTSIIESITFLLYKMLFDRRMITPFLLFLILLISSIEEGRAEDDVFGEKNRQPNFANEFPTINEIQEMSKLSLLVYKFHYQTNVTCDTINTQDSKDYHDINCHWYLHDTELGTQVLLVSNDVQQYIAIVFAGTDDIRTSLEDANIFTKPFGNNNTITLPYTDNNNNNNKIYESMQGSIMLFLLIKYGNKYIITLHF